MPDAKPRIVVLDGYTLNPGDLSWDELNALGDCTIHDRTAPDQVLERIGNAEIVLTNKVVLSAEVLRALSNLQYVGVLATGYNVADMEAACERGIVVTNVPSYSTPSVAQTVFAHVLNLAQNVGNHSAAVRAGRWTTSPDFCFWDTPLVELGNLTMGIVGLGQIGRETAKLAHTFGMNVLTTVRTAREVPDYVTLVELDTLFCESDVVSLHCPLTPETTGLVNGARLALMKPTAWLINTSRGPLVDEAALADALNSGTIAGAGLDVLSQEPPPADNPLLAARNCFITPHIAWATKASRTRLMDLAVKNVAAYLAGTPQNRVS